MRILTARWLLPVASPPIENGAIAISGDQIAAVDNLAAVTARFPEAVVQQLGEAAILPGLVNVHTHLELTVFRGRLEMTGFKAWIDELVRLKRERLTPEDLRWSALLGCIEAIRSGVTTVADTAEANAALPALIESGQRGVVFQECFGPAAEQAAESIDQLKRRLDAHEQRLSESSGEVRERLRVGISPHAPYTVSPVLYRRVAELAEVRNLDMALHAAESSDEEDLLRRGTGPFAESLRRREIKWVAPNTSMISYLDRLGVLSRGPLLIHCVNVDERDLELMAEKGARMAHCPKSNAKFGHGIAPLGEALRSGIRAGLGTDSVASNNNCDLIEEARFASLLHRATESSPEEFDANCMLRLMTIDGARTLGLEDQIGSLEVGKKADLIAIDLSRAHNTPHDDPAAAIVFASSGRDCILTVVNGGVLYEGGKVKTVDEAAVVAECRGRACPCP